MIKIFCFLACCSGLFIGTLAYGQNDITAVESRLNNASEPEKIKLLNQVATLLLRTNPDKAIDYSNQALLMISQLTDDEVKISHHKLQIEGEKQIPVELRLEEAIAYNNLGKGYYAKNQYAKAIRQFNQALEISEQNHYEAEKKTAIENLVIVDETLKAENTDGKIKWDKALKNKLEALKIGKKIDQSTQNLSLFTLEKIAAIHEKKKNYEGAISFHQKTIPVYEASQDKLKTAEKLNHIADLYKQMGNYREALKYYDLAMDAKGAMGDTIGVAHSMDSIKAIYDDLSAFNKNLPVAAVSPEIDGIRERTALIPKTRSETDYITLSEDYAEKGDYKKSLENFKLYAATKDQLTAKEKDRQIEMIQADFLLKNKTKEIALLQQQKQLQQSDLNKKELELTRYEHFRNTLIGALSLVIIVALMVYWQFRTKRKAHQQLEETYYELENTHKQLQSAQIQLVQAEKMASLGQLTAGIAHEINNPINFVSANIEPLKNDVSDIMEVLNKYEQVIQEKGLSGHFETVYTLKEDLEIDYIRNEIPQLLHGIEEGAIRTKEIVKGLRIFSRLDENESKLFDVHESLESTLTLLRNRFTDRIEIVKQYGDLPAMEGYPGKINQVLMNILNNAIYAIAEKGKIIISTKIVQNQVYISIRDNGTGMTPEVKNRIFEPFFTTKDVGIGTGLGLAISYGIIEQHKGRIEVESHPGIGTTFIISLPLKQKLD